MAARLGRVIYFATCIVAILLPFLFVAMLKNWEALPVYLAVSFVLAALVWAFGRAARYVLAGE